MSDFDPSKLTIRKTRRQKELDPEKIFESLTLRGSIQNPWGPQTDALRTWQERRSESDLVIEMNTGGGKTLVGLLVGQSLVNETGKHVLFVCPTKQLIEQAASKAAECGLEVATYMGGSWSNREVTDEGRGICITNYDAAFNGKSIFNREEIGGLILDDAHVAGSTIRSLFTITISRDEPLYIEIIKIFRGYFAKSSQEQRLDSAIEGDPNALLYLPMYEWKRCHKQVTQLLLGAGVDTQRKWLFAWEHVKDHLDRCVVLIAGSRIEIAPPVVPLHRLPCLQKATRRIYLTATVPSPADFVKTFGVVPHKIIKPKGKLGEAQRLFLFAEGDSNEEQRDDSKKTIRDVKACIITPSHSAANEWSDVGVKFAIADDQSAIEAFKESKDQRKLILVARYNGVDLPGDSCRILVIDGLPRGTSLLNRFLDESLQILSLRAANTAIRMVQAVGRIFRSNTDHGVVILSGTDVNSWTRSPFNLKYLPSLLQRQIQLGLSLMENVKEGKTSRETMINAVLTGDRKWDSFYKTQIDEFETEPEAVSPDWLLPFCQREQKAYELLWEGSFEKASQAYRSLADDTHQRDKQLAAWYRHWEGAACELSKDKVGAWNAYRSAADGKSELGRPESDSTSVLKTSAAPVVGPQAERIARLLEKRAQRAQTEITLLQQNLAYGSNTKPAEQALEDLGTFLGLVASRPDTPKQGKTGPDVAWRHPETRTGAAIEAKTDKKDGSMYQKKDDIGQFHDHIQFLSQKYPDESFYMVIVGKELRVSPESNPPEDLHVVDLTHFKSLAAKVQDLYAAVVNDDGTEPPGVTVQRWLDHLGLNWPSCLESLPSRLATDLQRTHSTDVEDH